MSIRESEPIQVGLFQEILKTITRENPIMIELGCAEAEYSRLFYEHFLGKCRNICIDILPRQLVKARKNCPKAEIIHGYVGQKIHKQELVEDNFGAKKIYVTNLVFRNNPVDIVHMDIQGAEPYVMDELTKYKDRMIENVRYFFISIHDTYEEVKRYIPDTFEYLYDDPKMGGEGDGLIVIRNKKYD